MDFGKGIWNEIYDNIYLRDVSTVSKNNRDNPYYPDYYVSVIQMYSLIYWPYKKDNFFS